MAESNKPLVAVITRLVPQKGIPLIKAALYRWGGGGGCRGRMRERVGGR
jgi:hypothetical protein